MLRLPLSPTTLESPTSWMRYPLAPPSHSPPPSVSLDTKETTGRQRSRDTSTQCQTHFLLETIELGDSTPLDSASLQAGHQVIVSRSSSREELKSTSISRLRKFSLPSLSNLDPSYSSLMILPTRCTLLLHSQYT